MLQEVIGLELLKEDLIIIILLLERLSIILERKIHPQNLMIKVPGGHLHPGMVFFGSAVIGHGEIFTALILFDGIFRIMFLRVSLLHLFMRNLPLYFGLVQRKDFF